MNHWSFGDPLNQVKKLNKEFKKKEEEEIKSILLGTDISRPELMNIHPLCLTLLLPGVYFNLYQDI